MAIIQSQIPEPTTWQSDIEVIHIQGIELVPLVTVRQSQNIHMQRRH